MSKIIENANILLSKIIYEMEVRFGKASAADVEVYAKKIIASFRDQGLHLTYDEDNQCLADAADRVEA